MSTTQFHLPATARAPQQKGNAMNETDNRPAVVGQVKPSVRRLAGCALVCAALALTACSGEIAGWKVTAAQEVCSARGGIDRLTNTFGSGVVCRDGYWQEIKGKP